MRNRVRVLGHQSIVGTPAHYILREFCELEQTRRPSDLDGQTATERCESSRAICYASSSLVQPQQLIVDDIGAATKVRVF